MEKVKGLKNQYCPVVEKRYVCTQTEKKVGGDRMVLGKEDWKNNFVKQESNKLITV